MFKGSCCQPLTTIQTLNPTQINPKASTSSGVRIKLISLQHSVPILKIVDPKHFVYLSLPFFSSVPIACVLNETIWQHQILYYFLLFSHPLNSAHC
jgi:hypothetical protein